MNGSSDHSCNQNGNIYDDLTQIEGIGVIRQRWLRETLNVYTFKDLAELAPQQIDIQLRHDRKPVALHDIERWIAQAQALVGLTGSNSSASNSNQAAPQPISNPMESALVESDPVESDPVESDSSQGITPRQHSSSPSSSIQEATPDQWEPLASFVVEFQSRQNPDHPEDQEYRTLVRCLDTERVRILPGLAAQQAQQWMWVQLDDIPMRSLAEESLAHPDDNGHERDGASTPTLGQPPSVETSSLEETSAPHTAVSIRVTQVLIRQAMEPVVSMAFGSSEPQILGSLQAHRVFQPEIVFELCNLEPAQLQAHQVIVHIHVYAYNRATGSIVTVGAPHRVSIDQVESQYGVTMPAVNLQQGLYRVKVLLSLEGVPSIPGYSEIPLLQVI